MALHQLHRLVRIELAEAVRQHRHAMMPSRHQHIEQPADPRPIRRSPEQVARLREELMRQLHARQMPKQHPMPMKRPLRTARGAGGVDDDGGIVRPGIDRREHIGSPRQRLLKTDGPFRRAIDAEHQFQSRQAITQRRHLFIPGRVGHQHPGAAVAQPVFQRLRPEQGEQRDRDQPRLEAGDMGNRRLRRLRQQHGQPVTALKPMRRQHIAEPVGQPPHLREGMTANGAVLLLHDQGHPAGIIGVLVADIDADVVAVRDLPREAPGKLRIIVVAGQHGVSSGFLFRNDTRA